MANPENLATSLLPHVNHNPDVLSCLANLSNDEVFTPPNVANAMLDMLPQELFKNPDVKFLDPVCKSGVFLREITKRLMEGLSDKIPDLQKRLDHILHNQIYGIAITELTSLLSRRTLYCTKYPNCDYSISRFDNITGNIRYKAVQHTWRNGKCVFCGASREQYERETGLESHAYEFIHTKNSQEIFEDMKFDVIIGNPPYQLNDGGANASATPIYQKFVANAKKLNSRYLTMIIPARWFSAGKGLDDFRSDMLKDKRIKKLCDYPDSSNCFHGVQIKGGICFFLWDSKYNGKCEVTTIRNNNSININYRYLLESGCDTFIRFNESINIFHKINKYNENKFDKLVSSRRPFGFDTSYRGEMAGDIKLFHNKGIGKVQKDTVIKNKKLIYKYKIFITKAYGAGEDFPHQILNKPFIGYPKTCCTETYLLIGPFDNEIITNNVISYIATKFFRFLVMLKKATQDATSKVYSLVPIQDFSKHWTDAELYTKYNLTQEEIDFIESMIKPMDLSTDTGTGTPNA